MSEASNRPSMRYATVVADPPWEYADGTGVNPRAHIFGSSIARPLPYPTMSHEDIAALPVSELADADAHLYCWTTQKHLEPALAIVSGWGFKTASVLVWCKKPYGWQPGPTYMNTVEFVVFAKRGSLPAKERCERQWWEWPRGKHSAKPEAFLDIVEMVSPGPYLELFARRNRFGWDTWGNESLEHVEVVA